MPNSKSVPERSIIFTAEEIRAHQDGRKSQVRQVIKPQPISQGIKSYGEAWEWHKDAVGFSGATLQQLKSPYGLLYHCPFGVPGNRLWVKETFRRYVGEGSLPDKGVLYKADGLKRTNHGAVRDWHNDEMWKPSTNMARWASRFLLEIMEVRVEKLQDISINDCYSEGCILPEIPFNPKIEITWAIGDVFAKRWDLSNVRRGHPWKSNPWVWVLNYKGV